MSEAASLPEKVHLVGSIGLDSVEEVFHICGTVLGKRVTRIPDGEPGGRRMWISWQYPLLRSHPMLTTKNSNDPYGLFRPIVRKDDVKPGELHFGELGYVREARASYLDFVAAREKGDIPEGVRFQVCLPTPFAVVHSFCAPEERLAIEEPYEAAMIKEVEVLQAAIPHADLCIQWDICMEMVAYDGQSAPLRSIFREDELGEYMRRLERLCAPVADDVELGFHLCYGDLDGVHFFDPKDATKMVEFANAIAATVKHPVAYIHMPVPIGRTDDAFFAPFDQLKLDPKTEIFLGVVHAQDGAEGVAKRVAAARKHVPKFGIATECGMARARNPERVRQLIKIHADASRAPA